MKRIKNKELIRVLLCSIIYVKLKDNGFVCKKVIIRGKTVNISSSGCQQLAITNDKYIPKIQRKKYR